MSVKFSLMIISLISSIIYLKNCFNLMVIPNKVGHLIIENSVLTKLNLPKGNKVIELTLINVIIDKIDYHNLRNCNFINCPEIKEVKSDKIENITIFGKSKISEIGKKWKSRYSFLEDKWNYFNSIKNIDL